MLAANQAVARRLFKDAVDKTTTTNSKKPKLQRQSSGAAEIGNVAAVAERRQFRSSLGTILRRHPAPKATKMEELVSPGEDQLWGYNKIPRKRNRLVISVLKQMKGKVTRF